MYREKAPSNVMVTKWTAEFRRVKHSLEDDHRCEIPVWICNNKTVTRVNDVVMAHRQPTVRNKATTLAFSSASVHRILTQDLAMRGVFARWVLKLLTPFPLKYSWFCRVSTLICDHGQFMGSSCWPETKTQSEQWKPWRVLLCNFVIVARWHHRWTPWKAEQMLYFKIVCLHASQLLWCKQLKTVALNTIFFPYVYKPVKCPHERLAFKSFFIMSVSLGYGK